MTQIILVDTNKELTTVLRANLNKKFGWEVIVKESAPEALSMIQILTDVELIICKEVLGKELTAQKICNFLVTNKADFEKELPVLIIGEKKQDYIKSSHVEAEANWETVMSLAASLLGQVYTPVPIAKLVIQKPAAEPIEVLVEVPVIVPVAAPAKPIAIKENFRPLSSKYLLNLHNLKLPFDSFTRTKKKDKDYEFNLKIVAGTEMERTDIERMIMRSGGDFFIPNDQYAAALKFAQDNLLKKLNDTSIGGLDRVQLASDAFDLSLELITDLAIDDFCLSLIDENISGLKPILNSSNVFALFNNGQKLKKLSYGFSHFFLTTILLSKVVLRFDWGTEELKEKMQFIVYAHDLNLQNDKLIRAHHHFFKESKSLSPEEAAIVWQHALSASQVAEKLKGSSPELVQIIKEHHGIKSGKGFSESLSIIISPLSMCFLTTEEFVTHLLDVKTEMSTEIIKSIFTEMEPKYSKLTYEQTLKFLAEVYK